MNEQVLTLRDWIRACRKQATGLENACGGNPKGELLGIIGQYRRGADDLEKLIDEQLVIHVTEGLEPDDADFIYRHVIGRKPEEMP